MNKLPLLLTALVVFVAPAQAQRTTLAARDALGLVSSQFGPQSVQWVAEMRAQGGVPQPSDWQILAHDARAPRLLYRFWAGGGRAGDGGLDDLRYPDDVPVGYFNASQIAVDSVAAFTIAEGEARKARMAFDSCDYLLRLREYSSEPIWRLELIDANRRLVGKLYLSASTGQVMRTIWIYRDQRGRPDGLPLILDSLAPGGQTSPVDLTGPIYSPDSGAAATGIPAPPALPAPGSVPGQVPGSMNGIPSVPAPPTPGVSIAGNPPYAPVDANGRPVVSSIPSTSGGGIPAPPPAATVPPAPVATVPPAATIPAPAPNPEPTKPPVSSSGGGSSDRIPPPPIPR